MADYGTVLWAARCTIAMHVPAVQKVGGPDPRARWRDLLQPQAGTTYRVGRCPCCGEGGCALLDAARQVTALVETFLRAGGGDGRPARQPDEAGVNGLAID